MRKNIFRSLALMLALLLTLAACGSTAYDETTAEAAYDMAAAEAPAEDAGWSGSMAVMEENAAAAEPAAEPAKGGETYDETANYAASLKIIRTGDLSLETEAFDQTDAFIRKTVTEYNGLLAESSISGTAGYRYASYTARVPSDSFEDFFYAVSGTCTVVNQTISAEDVTERYTDLSTQLETNKKKYARLLELLDTAETLTDLYSIQSEIANVEYEIDSITGILNGLDSRISYSTIYIGVTETNRTSAVPEDPGFLASLSAALKNGTNSTIEAFQGMLISLAYHWFIWLVILAIAVIGVTVFLRIRRKKRKQAELAKTASPEDTPPSDPT